MWRVIREALCDLFLPRCCLLCECGMERNADLVCTGCLGTICPLSPGCCRRCSGPVGTVDRCAACAAVDPAIITFRAWCAADDPVARRVLHAFKYDGWHALATPMARCMAAVGAPLAAPALVPVPLAPGRRAERGYNQAELLARALGRLWNGHVADVLVRVRETPSQTRLTRMDRFANVADAFRVDATRCRGMDVERCVLVDDVMTTGATLNGCAAALRAIGVGAIHCVTFGRAREPRATTPASRTVNTSWEPALPSTASAASVVRSCAPPRNPAPPSTLSPSTT